MQVTVEDVSSVKKKIHVEIPREEVSTQLDSAYKNLQQKAKIKGYRPGKVPRSVLERHFKKDVHSDVISNIVQNSFPQAIKESDLAVLDTADLDTPELDPGSDFKYTATVELKPELPDIDFKGLHLKKTEYAVDDSNIDTQLEMLRKHLAEYKPVNEDRGAREGDFVVIDYEGFKDGEPFAQTPFTADHSIRLGEHAFTEDFDKAIVGMKPGEGKEITVTFPEDHSNKELAGQEITFTVTLKEIKEEILPPFDDAFAKNFGPYETMDELRAEIERNIRQGNDKRAEQEVQEQIFKTLLKNEFEVPDVLVKYELDEIAREMEHRFSQNGLSMDQLGMTPEIVEQQYRPVAEHQARRHLLLNKIIEQENIDVSDEELDAEYEKLSSMIGQPMDFIKKFYKEHPEKQDGFKIALLEKKAVDLIINHATVETVKPEEKQEASTGDGAESQA